MEISIRVYVAMVSKTVTWHQSWATYLTFTSNSSNHEPLAKSKARVSCWNCIVEKWYYDFGGSIKIIPWPLFEGFSGNVIWHHSVKSIIDLIGITSMKHQLTHSRHKVKLGHWSKMQISCNRKLCCYCRVPFFMGLNTLSSDRSSVSVREISVASIDCGTSESSVSLVYFNTIVSRTVMVLGRHTLWPTCDE